MIKIIPSIAIRRGRVVKMRKGDPESERAYDENPLDLAKRFQDHGVDFIHLVDLDGAERGSPTNYHIMETIVGHTGIKIDFTGGISTEGDMDKAFEYGASQVTASSIAVTEPETFASWIVTYGRERITLGADVTDTQSMRLLYRGWRKKSELTLNEQLSFFEARGLKYVKSTDVSRDGVLEGPAFEFYHAIRKQFPDLSILASGGVRGIADIEKLNEAGVFAVIFGKAYYEGKLKLEDLQKFIVGQAR